MSQPRTPIAQLLDDLLTGGYDDAARQVVASMRVDLQSGVVNQRINELLAEAERLQETGERLSPDNPVYLQFRRDLSDYLQRNVTRVTDTAPSLTEAGVDASNTLSQQLTIAGMPDDVSALVQRSWNRPDPQAVASLVDFTGDNEFREMLSTYSDGILENIQNRITYGFVNGWGARRSARAIADIAQGMPISQAENLMRTLHLVSYRRGTAATHAANARILQPVALRVAVLDPRTCLTCIALHGDEIPLGEPVADHYQGRCTALAQVRGFNRVVTPGVTWFESLPPERQAEQRAFANSPGAYAAYQDGAVQLRDFVGQRTDPLFGEMVYQESLRGVLGEDARNYYRR